MVQYLQLDQFEPDQVLETRLYEASQVAPGPVEKSPEPSFLDRLASGTPTPGGGSAAAFTGAGAAALVAMVARLTVGKKKYASVEFQMWNLIERAELLRASLTAAVEEDAAAFDAILSAVRLPKNTPEEQSIRAVAMEKATLGAAQVPLAVCHKVVDVMDLAVQAASLGNLNAISDAASGFALARAALTGAGLNVRVNLINLQDQSTASGLIQSLVELEERARILDTALRAALKERINLTY